MSDIVKMAEAWCATRTRRIAPPSNYIAGFEMPNGRQIALERNRAQVYVWTEQVSLDAAPAAPVRIYSAEKSRNSNLNAKNCPRLSVGNPVLYWIFHTLDELVHFLIWYGGFRLNGGVVEAQPAEVGPALAGTCNAPGQSIDTARTNETRSNSCSNSGAYMGYQTTTVADTLNRINRELFIPAIQRPYVWTPEQIIRLFDSLMRGYPIGALMFWDLPPGSRDDWEIYRFVTHFRMGSIHNEPSGLSADDRVSLVLDGQQRLTSLLIGLQGSYTVKRKHKRKATDDAWDEKILFIDLAHAPEVEADEENDELSPIAEHYRFEFVDQAHPPVSKGDELWFEVGLILAAPTPEERDVMVQNWVEANLNLSEIGRMMARNNLMRLWDAVWHDRAVAYFTERSDSYDRVLDIFIRANDGGTRLSRSDLLMSVITLRWERFNAREETEALIDALTESLNPKRAITREFVLRAALFLNDLDFSIKVQNFVPANIRVLEQSWERTKEVLRFTARVLREMGFYGERLFSTNVVMLLAYYLHRSNPSAELRLADADRQRIRRWLVLLDFKSLLSLQTGATFSTYRSVVRRNLQGRSDFPLAEIADGFGRMGRSLEFGESDLRTWTSTPLEASNAEALLSLIYPDDLPNLRRRALPFVQSRFFMPDELHRAGVPDALMPAVQGFANKLILGVALDTREQESYFALPFEQWAASLSPEARAFHCLPDDPALYSLDRLPQWVSARRALLSQKLFGLIAAADEPADSISEPA
ncbi:MAG: hypothetical protein PWP11_2034 [Thauera sp.]|nr:DUF262 domain-containing protein [Thauera sp.]MDI3490757.1 hypothetical protein [Thauera sp.]